MSGNIADNRFEQCKLAPLYSICKDYPYQIIKTSTGKKVSEFLDGADLRYRVNLCVNDKCVKFYKHDIIAVQWLSYDLNQRKLQNLVIDHINKNHLDNHLDNLRIATRSLNAINRTVFSYINTLPADTKELHHQKSKNKLKISYNSSTDCCYHKVGTVYKIYPVLYNPQALQYYVIIKDKGVKTTYITVPKQV